MEQSRNVIRKGQVSELEYRGMVGMYIILMGVGTSWRAECKLKVICLIMLHRCAIYV